MKLSPQDFSALLDTLHRAVFEDAPWQAFLDSVQAAMGGCYASLTFRPIDQPLYTEHFTGRRPTEDVGRLFEEKYVEDPLPHRGMEEGMVYDLDRLMQRDDPRQRDFYREIMVPTGMLYIRTVRVREPNGAEAWLSVTGDRDFGVEDTALMTMLVPHLRTAVRSYFALARERFCSRLATDTIQRLNFGWLTLDAQCHVVEIDPHAERLLHDGEALRRTRANRLAALHPAIDRQIAAQVRSIAQDPEGARPHAINLSRDPWIDMLIAPIRTQPVPASPTPVAIAYLNGDRWSSADRCDQLVDLFGLLPSEARLAWAMAQGMSLAEAAPSLGITRETARSYAKRIYAKLGARGQVDVVRTILTSVLAIA